MDADFPGDFLFLDESGDLGMSERSTPVFVVGILHLRSCSALGRVIKRARRRVLGRRASMNELKWSESSDDLRREVIRQICRDRAQIVGVSAAVIDKQWINPTLARRREEVRYNFATRLAMEKGGLFEQATKGRKVHLTIDARNRRATEMLTEYVELLMANEDLPCVMSVVSADSARMPQLQAADFVVGAVYAAYAHGEWGYVNALKSSGIQIALRVPRKKNASPLRPL